MILAHSFARRVVWGGIPLTVFLVLTLTPFVARVDGQTTTPPVLAYYYIWFDESSWDRAKIDYPVLGRYASDDEAILESHVRAARDAGITGLLVSWKATEPLNRRLEALIEVAHREGVKLGIVYQGLDFDREPLPKELVSSDLDYFTSQFASDPVFDIFGAPLVVLAGTWEYSAEEIAWIAGQHKSPERDVVDGYQAGRLLLLASERNADGIRRLSPFVNGNAYYWSSVDPETFPGYQEKLAEMSEAVGDDGIWIAPAAPGFDARLVGGTRVVPRRDGETLRTEFAAAAASDPDAIGLISWNEFSENTHIEPSLNFGSTSLEVLASLIGGSVENPVEPQRAATSKEPSAAEFDQVDSSSPAGDRAGLGAALAIAVVLLTATAGVVVALVRTRRRSHSVGLG
jgi:hypothetical protein